MKVAIVDGDLSYPATSGKRLRTLNLMLGLASRHQITYIARGGADKSVHDQARAYFASHQIDARIIDDPLPPKRGLAFYGRLMANLLSSLPYSASSHRSDKMRQAVRAFAASNKVDLWQIEWGGYLYCLEGLGKPLNEIPIVLQSHNIESLIWQRYYEAQPLGLKRAYIAAQWRKFHRFEAATCRVARRVVAVSEDDAALARRWYGLDNVDVVSNGVDVGYYQNVRPRDDSRCVLYLSALDWRPNLDALAVLLDEIFPAVLRRLPHSRLAIVGRNPPAWLRQKVQTLPQVELHADVPDVRPYLEASAVMAVPLRIGGGSRLKILEALAAGLPVVSTRVGAEGLDITAGQHYTHADTAVEMSDALVDCLSRPQIYRQQAEAGRQIVSRRYDWAMLSDRLEQVWDRAVQGMPEGKRLPGENVIANHKGDTCTSFS